MPGRREKEKSEAILLSGATGFLGMELLLRCLEQSERHVYALVRADDQSAANDRLRGVIEEMFGSPEAHHGRWSAVPGDIEAPGLGLEGERRQELAAEVGEILHSAASVSFAQPLEEARGINVSGTARMLEFAELCRQSGGIRRFAHVSTAYVAGDHSGTFGEEDLEVGQDFRNSYERSKFEAEKLVREHAERLPVQIFRPSIIVGESGSGWTATFNVLYPPLRAFEAGAYPVLPARPSTPVDVVPVDYVADAIFELVQQPAERGEVHHLVAGKRATTAAGLAERASRYFKRPRPRMIAPALYRRLLHPLLVRLNRERTRKALRRTEALLPYFGMKVRFDDSRTRARLDPAGIRPPRPESYLHRLLAYAQAARWGRRRVTRAEANRSRAEVA